MVDHQQAVAAVENSIQLGCVGKMGLGEQYVILTSSDSTESSFRSEDYVSETLMAESGNEVHVRHNRGPIIILPIEQGDLSDDTGSFVAYSFQCLNSGNIELLAPPSSNVNVHSKITKSGVPK